MGRRHSTRGIVKARVYTLKMAARHLGVSEHTLRTWRTKGLRIIADKRPHLVRGEDLIDFLAERRSAGKHTMASHEFFCMTCKEPRGALAGSLRYTTLTTLTGRLAGICSECTGNIGRFSTPSEASRLGLNAPIQFKATG